MALIVQKFGGSSVADIDRIRNVANRVAEYRHRGDQVVVVVSAMRGVTAVPSTSCGPSIAATTTNAAAVPSSTSGYRAEIGAPQSRHFARSTSQESTGTLS